MLSSKGLGGVVGYHISLTCVSNTEGPEFKPRLSQYSFCVVLYTKKKKDFLFGLEGGEERTCMSLSLVIVRGYQ